MNEKDLMEMIRNSAEEVEIPDSLQPEQIQKKLEQIHTEKTKPKKKVIPFRKYASIAAALLLVAAAVPLVPLVTKNYDTKPELVQTEVPEMKENDVETGEVVHMNSYEELYETINQYYEKSRMVTSSDLDGGLEVLYDAPLAAGAVESGPMVEESVEYEDIAAAPEILEERVAITESMPAMGGNAARAEGDFSKTNTQEVHVDEADIVKTDGEYIYALDNAGILRIVKAAGTEFELISEIDFTTGENDRCLEMYLDGDLIQVVKREETYVTYEEEIQLPSMKEETTRSYYSVPETTTAVVTYDISDRVNPVKIGKYQQDGSYISSRKNGSYLYLFTSFYPEVGPTAQAKEYYVPKAGEEFIAYDEIYLPSQGNWIYDGKRYLLVASLENEQPDEAKDSIAVVSGADTFYVSENNIYSATSTWADSSNQTELVRIGYKDGLFTPGNCGKINGGLNDNFSLNEYDGNLRVVTTIEGWKKDQFYQANNLYVLDEKLQTVGKIEDLAKGETIQSARFMGKTGYFVTYENTDPLFSVDLSDPKNPKILGELKITGFSEYLHFYGENKLLGIGWETDPDTGVTEGLKCSMFDLSDPADVKETDRLILKDVYQCAGLNQYKAILAEPEKNLFGFAYCMQDTDWNNRYYYGVFTYNEDGIVPLKYIDFSNLDLFEDGIGYEEYSNIRGIYIGDFFYLVSNEGIAIYDMNEEFSLQDTLEWAIL